MSLCCSPRATLCGLPSEALNVVGDGARCASSPTELLTLMSDNKGENKPNLHLCMGLEIGSSEVALEGREREFLQDSRQKLELLGRCCW
jgi:hypothetical protein